VNTTWVDLYDASLIISNNASLQITSDFIEEFNSLLTLLKEGLA
jgi:hypothetical protein